jgi:hypothetical protein
MKAQIAGVLLALTIIVNLCQVATVSTATAAPGDNFTIVLIPDPQNESEYAPDVFTNETQWIADNKNTHNIVFITQSGDIVNTADNVTQWGNANMAVNIIDAAGIPYSIGPGNHDMTLMTPTSLYETYFGVSRFSGKSWYGGHYGTNNYNNYSLFSASGMDFIMINLQYESTSNQLNWADNLLKTYSNRRGIVVQHDIIDIDNSWVNEAPYASLKDNPNLFLMLCGHMHSSSDGAAYRVEEGDDGHTIYIMLADYQDYPNNGDGIVRILQFSPSENMVYATTYSTYTGTSITTSPDQIEIAYNMSGNLPPNTAAEILTYRLPNQSRSAIINRSAGTIDIPVPFGTDITSLIATFTTSANITSIKVNEIDQYSGVTVDNFSNPVTYTVTAADGTTTRNWVVTITVLPNTTAEILTYSLPGQSGSASINSGTGTVGISVPSGTGVTSLIATFTLSSGASARVGAINQVSGVTANNFSNPVTYTVTAADGTATRNWVITVTAVLASSDASLINLAISSGTLSPAFASGTTSYTNSVLNNIASVTVTPTVNVSCALVTVNSINVTSGSPSVPINLNVGVNTITIIVTAQDGETNRTYTINLTRSLPEYTGNGGIDFSGGSGGGGYTAPGITNITIYTNHDGVFNLTGYAASENGLATLVIDKGVKALHNDGTPMRMISITSMEKIPEPPVGFTMIGSPYNFGPDGATFSPSITLTLTYDPTKLPTNLDTHKMFLAWWNVSSNKWIELQTVVDTNVHTISAQIDRFSSFAAFTNTQSVIFDINNLNIEPSQVNAGEKAIVSVTVTNSGDLSGDCTVTLSVNGKKESSQTVTVISNASLKVNFDFVRESAGTYKVEVNSLSRNIPVLIPINPANFNIKSLTINPPEVIYGMAATITVVVENNGDAAGVYPVIFKIDDVILNSQEISLGPKSSQLIQYTPSTSKTGTRLVDVNGLEGSFTVKPPVVVHKTTNINWCLIGVMIIVAVAAAILTSLTVKRRRLERAK